MTTDSIPSKGSAKEKIQNAVFGLLLALGAYLILVTINPELLNLRLLEDLNRINARLAELRSVQFVELPINTLLVQQSNLIRENGDAFRQSIADKTYLRNRIKELEAQIAQHPANEADLQGELDKKRRELGTIENQNNVARILTNFYSQTKTAILNTNDRLKSIILTSATPGGPINYAAVTDVINTLDKAHAEYATDILSYPLSITSDQKAGVENAYNATKTCINTMVACAKGAEKTEMVGGEPFFSIDTQKSNECLKSQATALSCKI